MELRQTLQVIWKRLWLIILGTAVMAAVGFWIGDSRSAVYQASTSLLVTNAANEGTAATYEELLTKRPVIEAAAAPLGLDPREVERQIQVERIPGTSIIELTVEYQAQQWARFGTLVTAAAIIGIGPLALLLRRRISGSRTWLRNRPAGKAGDDPDQEER